VARTTVSPFGVTSGKWYWEIPVPDGANNGSNLLYHGVTNNLQHGNATLVGSGNDAWVYRDTGHKFSNNTLTAYGSPYTNANSIGIALDADNGYIWFSNNGVWQGGASLSEIENSDSTHAAFIGLTGRLFPVM